jgi:hypothetical protein
VIDHSEQLIIFRDFLHSLWKKGIYTIVSTSSLIDILST